MDTFARAAIIAATTYTRLPPEKAWDLAMAQASTKGSMQKKGCPRGAYLGLCEAGLVIGITAGSVGKIDKNGQYAIDAYYILKSYPKRRLGKMELWNQIDKTALNPNGQMNVVIALWENGLLH